MPSPTALDPPVRFPSLPLAGWRATKDTLHLYVQIVGKVRLALFPKKNHWWHVTLYVSPRGLTTRPIPYGYGTFEIAFDFIDHRLVVTTSTGTVRGFDLHDGLSVAAFYRQLFEILHDLGIEAAIKAEPYDRPTTTPFPEDDEHARYDAEAVHRFWTILVGVNDVLEVFRGRFLGKSTPVHFFWHSFDLVVTRFSGDPAPSEMIAGMGRVDREAYSHEVISFGFWPGDDNVPAPAFYSYTFPEPDGLREEPLAPEAATWETVRGGAMALLMYDAVREADAPRQALLDFLESSYQAGARRAGWDLEAFAL